MHLELDQDVPDMGSGGLTADPKLRSDLVRSCPVSEKREDLQLPSGQMLE